MSLSCECRVLSGRGLCDGSINGPEESYRVWCVWARSQNNIRVGTTVTLIIFVFCAALVLTDSAAGRSE